MVETKKKRRKADSFGRSKMMDQIWSTACRTSSRDRPVSATAKANTDSLQESHGSELIKDSFCLVVPIDVPFCFTIRDSDKVDFLTA
eukprot:scaffold3195_cov162-Amphora_coffeaeformis.AAC.10